MTEEEWLSSNDPCQLLGSLNHKLSERKLRLYCVACCRAHWHLLTQSASREAVDWVERYADCEVQQDELYHRLEYKSEGAAFRLEEVHQRRRVIDWTESSSGTEELSGLRGSIPHSRSALEVTAAYFANSLLTPDTESPLDLARGGYGDLLLAEPIRDIFGNPFRPVGFAPEWRTDTAVALAAQMYESRDFGAMPILADALQDAGCNSDDILNHCRTEALHVRGCWVVDLVLGKT